MYLGCMFSAPGAQNSRLTCGTLALVAIGVVNALGSVEARRAGAVVYVNLAHGPTEPWEAHKHREMQESLKECTYTAALSGITSNKPSSPANLHPVASWSSRSTPRVGSLLVQPTLQRFCPPGQLESEMAKPKKNKTLSTTGQYACL